MMYVAVVGAVFPAWANAASGLKTDATTRFLTTVFFIAFLPDVLLIVSALTDIHQRNGEAIAVPPPDPEARPGLVSRFRNSQHLDIAFWRISESKGH